MRQLASVMIIVLLTAMGCTENPFGGDDISGGHREIRGSVNLQDGGSAQGVYVWLEGVGTGAYTNGSGDFEMNLDTGSSQGGGGSLNGIYNLYFYLANYYLDSAQVVIRDGEFVYARASLNSDGRVTPPVTLHRFLRIITELEPDEIQSVYTGNIEVDVTLTACGDSCSVVIPGSVGGGLGAVLVKRTGSEAVSIYEASNLVTREKMLVGRAGAVLEMRFNTLTSPLEPGVYEVIPYLLICHEPLPDGLKASLAPNVEDLGPNYLKLPLRREGGVLVIN